MIKVFPGFSEHHHQGHQKVSKPTVRRHTIVSFCLSSFCILNKFCYKKQDQVWAQMWTGKVRTWKQIYGIQSNLRQTEGDRDTEDIAGVGQVKRTEQSAPRRGEIEKQREASTKL